MRPRRGDAPEAPAPGQAMMLDIRAAADFLGTSPKALRHLIERRRIPFRKLGRKVVLLRGELEQWIADLPGVSLDQVRAMQDQRRGA